MGYIPEGAKWYLADIIEEIRVEGDPRNVVHTNVVLIQANSPIEAFEKAIAVGKNGETSYQNPDGKLVNIRYRGLRQLNVIHEEIEDGAEIAYEEEIGLSEEEIQGRVRGKEELAVFAPIERSPGPDYAAREVVEEVYQRFPHLRGKRTPVTGSG
jgi:Domain of unknown function (DUF4288)